MLRLKFSLTAVNKASEPMLSRVPFALSKDKIRKANTVTFSGVFQD